MKSNDLTIAEVAALRGVTQQTVRNWIGRGLLKARVVRGQRVVSRRTAERFEPPRRGAKRGTRYRLGERGLARRRVSPDQMDRAKKMIDAGASYKAAADAVGVNYSTLWNWINDPYRGGQKR